MNVESAMQRLYEDASLTEELKDDDARLLLKWAEDQITQLAVKFTDEAAFEEALSSLMHVIKNANRVVGQREFADAEQQTERIDKMAEAAQGMGVIVASAQAADMKNKLDALSSTDAIKTLLNWITPGINTLTASAQAASESNAPEGNPPEPEMPMPAPPLEPSAAAQTASESNVPEANPPEPEMPMPAPPEPSAADQAKSLFSSLFDRLTNRDDPNTEDET